MKPSLFVLTLIMITVLAQLGFSSSNKKQDKEMEDRCNITQTLQISFIISVFPLAVYAGTAVAPEVYAALVVAYGFWAVYMARVRKGSTSWSSGNSIR